MGRCANACVFACMGGRGGWVGGWVGGRAGRRASTKVHHCTLVRGVELAHAQRCTRVGRKHTVSSPPCPCPFPFPRPRASHLLRAARGITGLCLGEGESSRPPAPLTRLTCTTCARALPVVGDGEWPLRRWSTPTPCVAISALTLSCRAALTRREESPGWKDCARGARGRGVQGGSQGHPHAVPGQQFRALRAWPRATLSSAIACVVRYCRAWPRRRMGSSQVARSQSHPARGPAPGSEASGPMCAVRTPLVRPAGCTNPGADMARHWPTPAQCHTTLDARTWPTRQTPRREPSQNRPAPARTPGPPGRATHQPPPRQVSVGADISRHAALGRGNVAGLFREPPDRRPRGLRVLVPVPVLVPVLATWGRRAGTQL